jgi:hypothetical protein
LYRSVNFSLCEFDPIGSLVTLLSSISGSWRSTGRKWDEGLLDGDGSEGCWSYIIVRVITSASWSCLISNSSLTISHDRSVVPKPAALHNETSHHIHIDHPIWTILSLSYKDTSTYTYLLHQTTPHRRAQCQKVRPNNPTKPLLIHPKTKPLKVQNAASNKNPHL